MGGELFIWFIQALAMGIVLFFVTVAVLVAVFKGRR